MIRPHPLGHTWHPDWSGVEDRYNELWCNAALREMRCETKPEPKPLPLWAVRVIVIGAQGLTALGVIGLFWAALT